MNKKIWVGSLLAVLMLVSISFVSSAEVNTDVEHKESPLFGIRTNLAIGERLQNLKAKLIGERIFFLPFPVRNMLSSERDRHILETSQCFTGKIVGCVPWGDITMFHENCK